MNMPRKFASKKFLDASLVPLENALLDRAKTIALQVVNDTEVEPEEDMEKFKAGLISMIRSVIAEEFQALAEELHHW